MDIAQHGAAVTSSRAGVGPGQPLPDLVIDLGDIAQFEVVHPHLGARVNNLLEPPEAMPIQASC